MNSIIPKTMMLIAIILAIWGIDISFTVMSNPPLQYIHTFWGQTVPSPDYFHMSLFLIMISACTLWVFSLKRGNDWCGKWLGKITTRDLRSLQLRDIITASNRKTIPSHPQN